MFLEEQTSRALLTKLHRGNVMRNYLLSATAIVASLVSVPGYATVITFDEPGIGSAVDAFYNGGGGPNLGADFLAGDWVVSTGFGQTSQPNFAFSQSGSSYLNIASGFTSIFSFNYGAFSNFTATVYDGLNGSGTALGSISLAANNVNTFSPVAINFSGIGRSFAISGNANQFGFDDVTFNDDVSGAVPEPATWALMLVGFGLVGGAMRRRQAVRVAYT